MFISEEEADRRVNSGDNLLRRLKIPLTKPELIKPEPTKNPVIIEEIKPVDVALDAVQRNPTDATEDDAVRLAILAGRRHLKTSDERGGRYPQQGNVPPIFRQLIGTAAALGTAANAAKSWGVNATMAHHYSHGRTGPETESPGLAAAIDHNILVVRDQVLGVLSTAVAGITPDKLDNKDAKDLSLIARNLASIMAATKPTIVTEQTNAAQVIVFSPESKEETTYETIEVG